MQYLDDNTKIELVTGDRLIYDTHFVRKDRFLAIVYQRWKLIIYLE